MAWMASSKEEGPVHHHQDSSLRLHQKKKELTLPRVPLLLHLLNRRTKCHQETRKENDSPHSIHLVQER
jgi:hypothetical protein